MAGDRMMRYIVPFYFDGAYEEVCRKLSEASDEWEPGQVACRYVYLHIYQSVNYAKGEKEKQGGVWRQNRQSAKINLWLKLRENEARYASISNSGIYLFRTGIGLFWYEIDFKDTELPVDTLIEYEDQLQTFGLNKREHFIYRVAGKKSFIVSDHPNLKEENSGKEEGKQPILQIREEKAPITGQLIEVYHRVPALSGKNVYLCADFEKHTETPVLEKKENERIDFCLTRLEQNESEVKAYISFREIESFSIPQWMNEKLQVLGCGISFCMMEGIKSKRGKKGQSETNGPRRALLYNYFSFEQEAEAQSDEGQRKQMLLDRADFLTAGHNKNFLRSPDVSEYVYQPFKDAYWYVSNSGCGCYVYKNEENRHYLKTNLSDNVRRDYFMIYILLLYQLYSLIHFSEKIEYELSADAKDYLKAPEAYNLKLKEIQAEINTFLLKSVHTSVSQMQTQNDFYQFAKKNLRLREEIQSLTAGVDFLEELLETQEEQRRQEKENAELLQRQQEEDKLSVGVAVLSLLAILSAFADGIGFLNEIKEAGSLMNLCRENIAYPIILVIVVLIGFVALVVCKDSAVRYWRSKRKALDRNVGE